MVATLLRLYRLYSAFDDATDHSIETFLVECARCDSVLVAERIGTLVDMDEGIVFAIRCDVVTILSNFE